MSVLFISDLHLDPARPDITEHFLAFLRYGRPSSFHTGLVRIAVFVFDAFLAVLFLIGFQAWLFYLAAIASLAAVLEEIAMILVMPDWSPDLRGGLVEALRRRRGSGGQRRP